MSDTSRATGAPFRALVRDPHLRWQGVSGLLAQVTQGSSGVGIILVVRQHGGSVALAGGVVGVLSIAAGIARPLQGRLMDRRGTPPVVAGTGIGHGVALTAIVTLAGRHAPVVALLALGVLAGAFLPPISSAMRVDWGEQFGADDRTAAYSLVYLVQEMAILAGPLLLAAMVASAGATAAVLVIASLTVVGGAWYASCSTSPSPRAPAAATPTLSVLRSSGVRVLIGVAMLLGGMLGAIEVAAPTLAISHHEPAAAGLLIAALSAGGIAGAALYATGRWRAEPSLQLIVLLAFLTTMVVLAGVAGPLIVAGVVLVIAGLVVNPSLTTISLLLDRHTPGGAAAEAFGWLSTGIAGGTGAASAIAGAVTRHGGSAQPAFAVAALAVAGATIVASAGHKKLRILRAEAA